MLAWQTMPSSTTAALPDYLCEEILLHPKKRKFPAFDLTRLLGTVFEPTQGCRVCILTDFDDPAVWLKGHAYLQAEGFPIQKKPTRSFIEGFRTKPLQLWG